jgi:hypothetical protein
MTDRVHQNPHLIFSEGTHVVSLRDIMGTGGRSLHEAGAPHQGRGAWFAEVAQHTVDSTGQVRRAA